MIGSLKRGISIDIRCIHTTIVLSLHVDIHLRYGRFIFLSCKLKIFIFYTLNID